MLYIEEVDGLRALAIIAVLLFHADVSGFGGGYVGVDVFFVISGFLMSRLIKQEVDATGSVDFIAFYTRRMRRLLPALFAVIAATLLLSEVLLPNYFVGRVAGSAFCGIISLSNFYFWLQSGYFDDDNDTKPLLHTWSLGVEEQFYLIWPALVLLVNTRVPSRLRTPLLVLGFVASLYYSNRSGTSSTAFYLLPARAHEFFIGALLVQLPPFPPHRKLLADALSFLGLAAVITAIVGFDERTAFPSRNALLPCIGAALLIYASPSSLLSNVLKSSAAKWVGAISYSLYLVHWPVVIFWKATTLKPLSPASQIIILMLSLGLAAIWHRWIETPFRARGKTPVNVHDWSFRAGCATVASVLLIYAGLLTHNTGLRGLFGETSTAIIPLPVRDVEVTSRCAYRLPEIGIVSSADFAHIGALATSCLATHGPAIIVLGDSHATDLFNAIAYSLPDRHVIGLTRAACRIDASVTEQPLGGCQFEFFNRILSNQRDAIDQILYTQKGSYLLTNFRDMPANIDAIHSVLARLQEWSAKVPVIWVGPHNEPNVVPAKVAQRGEIWVRSLSGRENRAILALDVDIGRLATLRGVAYVSAIKAVDFQYARDIIVNSAFTYSDRDHWSADGERIFGQRLLDNSGLRASLQAVPLLHTQP